MSIQPGDWATYWTRRRGEKPRLVQCIVKAVNSEGTIARVEKLDHLTAVNIVTIETARLQKMIVDQE